jgi:hypothetical protein
MLGDEGETHPSSAAAPAGSRHRSTAERVSSGRFDPFAEPPGNGRYLRIAVERAVFARPRNREAVVVCLRTPRRAFFTRVGALSLNRVRAEAWQSIVTSANRSYLHRA